MRKMGRGRVRDVIVKFRARESIIKLFDELADEQGRSRSGALEAAMLDFLTKHKGVANVGQ